MKILEKGSRNYIPSYRIIMDIIPRTLFVKTPQKNFLGLGFASAIVNFISEV